MGVKIEHTTDGVINRCSECGEELKSLFHRCNPFRGAKFSFPEAGKGVSE